MGHSWVQLGAAGARAVLALTLLLAAPRIGAEPTGVRTYSVEHGLAQSQVTAVLQDCRGYLWVGSHGAGLSRFDGSAFRIFSSRDGLAGDIVRSLTEGSCGTLWIGTDRGLSSFDGQRISKLALPGDPNVIRALHYDGRGVLWIGTESGAFRYEGGEAEPVALPVDGIVAAIHADAHGAVWFGTRQGLIRLGEDGPETWTDAQGLPHASVQALEEDRRGTLWIGTLSGLARRDGAQIRPVEFTSPSGSTAVNALLSTRDGKLWVGTGAGVCRLDEHTSTCFGESEGLPSPVVWALAEDRERNLWVGTYRGGLARFSSQPFVRVAPETAAVADTVRAFHEAADGSIWIGTFRNGALRLDGEDRVVQSFGEELVHPFVLAIHEDVVGAIWLGTRHGVSRWSGGRFREWRAADGLPDDLVRDFLEDEQGRILVATNRGGIAVIDGDRVGHLGPDEGLTQTAVMKLAQGADGIWIGTLDGIYHYDGATIVDASARHGWVRRDVYSLLERPDGTVWVGAYGSGVFRCRRRPHGGGDGRACDRLDRRHGLPTEKVVSLLFDRRGQLWVGTEDGVARVDVESWQPGSTARVTTFDGVDGLGSAECVHNAAVEDSRGRIWFGTLEGAYRHAPEEYRANPVPPRVHVTRVTVLGNPDVAEREVEHTSFGKLEFLHPANGVDIEFVGISLRAPEGVRYRHRLLGYGDTWSSPGPGALARYRNLAPGSYEFQVIAANADGVWSEAPTSFSFVVVPPFWRTPWFYGLAAVGTLAALVGIVKLRVARLDRQNRRLEATVAESTRKLAAEARRVERLNAELEEKVEDRTRRLVQANERLRDEIARRERLEKEMLRASKLESLAVLAGGIAHDFNNLLTAILGNISLARLEFDRQGLSSVALDQAEQASLRSRELTTQLLTFSKGGAPVTRALDVEEVTRETIGLVLRGSKVRAVFDFVEGLSCVQADAGQLGQVLGNLAINAAQAMPGGGILQVRCENVFLTSDSPGRVPLPEGRYVRLSLRDEGPGIEESVRQRIFDPYFTTKQSGHGLGLATVHSIVLRHSGWIEVDSTPGEGATFHVYLPASDALAEPEQPEPRVPGRRGARVLVMDDEAMVREVASAMLRSLGCNVQTAADGGQAIDLYREALRRSPFDLVILDLTVPGGLGGVETVGEILRIHAGARIVVSSGYSQEGALGNHERHGFVDALPKPFTIAELERVLETALDDERGDGSTQTGG